MGCRQARRLSYQIPYIKPLNLVVDDPSTRSKSASDGKLIRPERWLDHKARINDLRAIVLSNVDLCHPTRTVSAFEGLRVNPHASIPFAHVGIVSLQIRRAAR